MPSRVKKGRTSLKGTRRVPRKNLRRSYTYEFKQTALRNRGLYGLDHVIATHWPHASDRERPRISHLLSSWKSGRSKINAATTTSTRSSCKARPTGVACVLSPDIEDDIGCWVRAMRKNGVPVSQQMIQIKAGAAAKDAGLTGFAASYCWLKGFKRRQRLSLRTRGTQGQQPPEDAHALAEEFGKLVAAEAARLGVNEVWNADETAVFFELIPRRTVDTTGTKTVWVRCAGADKRRVSVLLLGSSAGRKKPPFIVFKEPPSKVPWRQRENESLRHGFGSRVWSVTRRACLSDTTFANRAGWLTGSLIVQWLDKMFRDEPGPKLLLLDEFSGHWTNEVLTKCEELQITLLKIPAGCTSVSQPADVSWNRPFKAHIRKQWVDRLVETVRTSQPLVPPPRDIVCSWVKTAWDNLDAVENGFRASHIVIDTDAQVGELSQALGLVELGESTQVSISERGEDDSATEDE